MSGEPAEIQTWLRQLKWSLASVPSPERDDILAETRAHLEEAIASGRTPAEALQGFGAPEEYARRFVDEMDVAGALGSQKAGAMLSVIGRRIHRSVVAAAAAVALVVLVLLAFTALTMFVFKLSDPVHAGLWRNAHEFFIGKIDNPASATDLLGNWLYPLMVAVLFAAWLLGRLILLGAMRALARPR